MPQKRIPDLDTALLTPQSNNPEGVTSHIIYVDSSRTDNYKNPNGSAERPFKTIPEAFASVPIQESEIDLTKTYLIYLLPGIYPEPINITSPVTIKGVDFLTCIITGKITVVQQLFMIQQVYIQEIECTEVRLNLIANCQINNAICTNSILRFITCTITNFEVYNSRIYLDLNAIVTSEFYIESDTELPYPIESSTVTEIIMGYSRWENPTFEFEMLNEGTIDIKFTNSYCESALVLQNGLFVHNFASVLTNATGDGFYESKAGYPVSGQSMTITLTPAEGQWKIDDGEWNISGATVSGLNFDQAYNVSFDTVEHYNTPDAVEITLLQGENDVRVIDYAPKDGTVTLTLDPNTARWKVDDGDWNVSGATLTDVTTMVEHTTTFEDVDHYITPEPMTGSLTPEQDLIADIEYTPINGTITVNITPAGAVTAGAQWSIDAGETWNDSEATLTDIVPDDYSVTYKETAGYVTPEADDITVEPGEAEVVNKTYIEE